jgi:hypothetical protein
MSVSFVAGMVGYASYQYILGRSVSGIGRQQARRRAPEWGEVDDLPALGPAFENALHDEVVGVEKYSSRLVSCRLLT